MIPIPSGVRIWLAGGVTDMRCGMNSLALKVQEGINRHRNGGSSKFLCDQVEVERVALNNR